MTETKTKFPLELISKTPNDEYNFIGIAIKYFDKINDLSRISQETKYEYYRRYIENIFPYVDTAKPINSYTPEDINDLLELIKNNNYKDESSLATNINHLIYDPINEYYNSPDALIENDKTWGSSSNFNNPDKEDSYAGIMSIKKSFNVEEEKKIYKILNNSETNDGRLIGLAIMFFAGIRNAEACGLNFSDIKELSEYPGCYYISIVKTTRIGTNINKIGGKTYNAPRQLPLVNELYELIEKRKKFIEKEIGIFPYKDKKTGKIYKSIDEFPIACRNNDFTARCSATDLTNLGREVLKGIGMNENDIAGISYLIKIEKDTEFDLQEKEPSAYLFRRNMATHIYCLGFNSNDCQYYMGHAIDGTPMKRVDMTDELYLHNLWIMLQKHPLNNYVCRDDKSKIISSLKKGQYLVSLTNKENNDQIHLFIPKDKSIDIVEKHIMRENNNTVDIEKYLIELYK